MVTPVTPRGHEFNEWEGGGSAWQSRPIAKDHKLDFGARVESYLPAVRAIAQAINTDSVLSSVLEKKQKMQKEEDRLQAAKLSVSGQTFTRREFAKQIRHRELHSLYPTGLSGDDERHICAVSDMMKTRQRPCRSSDDDALAVSDKMIRPRWSQGKVGAGDGQGQARCLKRVKQEDASSFRGEGHSRGGEGCAGIHGREGILNDSCIAGEALLRRYIPEMTVSS
jgi:hypothetical protein